VINKTSPSFPRTLAIPSLASNIDRVMLNPHSACAISFDAGISHCHPFALLLLPKSRVTKRREREREREKSYISYVQKSSELDKLSFPNIVIRRRHLYSRSDSLRMQISYSFNSKLFSYIILFVNIAVFT